MYQPYKEAKTPPVQKIYNSLGKLIELEPHEKHFANMNQKIMNSLGFEVNITTLTSIVKEISEQKFFEIPPGDYMPIKVGNMGWSTQITTFRSFSLAGDFEEGIINTAANNARLATADAGVDSITIPNFTWAKESTWATPQVEYSAKFGNWDIVTEYMIARKKNWDLGIQRVAFLGLRGNSQCLGLLTLDSAGVNSNTAVITQSISSMDPDQFSAFVQQVVEAYRKNCNRTNWPNRFAIPESDWNGLTAPVSPTFPFNSKLEYLEKSFKTATMKPDFKILPLAYGDMQYSGLSTQRYTLYNGTDAKSLRMDIPVPYTTTVANSLNSFQFQNVSYGQFTGAMAYRPLETLYFDYIPS